MIISYAKRFVMLAPWKTASSTLHARLGCFNESPYSRFYDFQPSLNRVAHQHITCAEFAAFPEASQGLAVASFVRNPYDRAYSGFLQLQRDIVEQPLASYSHGWIRDLVLRQLDENRVQLERADFDFNAWMCSIREEQVFEVGHNTSFPLHPAHYWTHLRGETYVSFIGRVERFEQDLDLFCDRYQIPPLEAVNANMTGSIGARLPQSPYRYAPLMERRALDKINDLFSKDFELFGYEVV